MALQATLGSIMVYKGNLFSGRSTCSYMVLCPCLEFGDKMLYTCSFFFQIAPEFSNFCESIIQENGCMDSSCWKTTRTRKHETIKANW